MDIDNNTYSTDLVSIIIPVYNAQATISRCLNSCLRQDYQNIEILIINDGSTDKTRNLIDDYIKTHPSIRVIDITNSGQGYARNIGISNANGAYIFFLDADDTIQDITISILKHRICLHDSDIVFCDWCYINENNQKYNYSNFSHRIPPGIINDAGRSFLFQKTYFSVNKLYKKSFLREEILQFGEGYIYEDNEFYVGALLKAKKIAYAPYPLYNVHVNNSSSTKSNYKSNHHSRSFSAAVHNTLEKYKKDIEQKGFSAFYIRYIIHRIGLYTTKQKRVPIGQWKSFTTTVLNSLNAIDPSTIDFPTLPFRYRSIAKIARNNDRLAAFLLIIIFYFSKFSLTAKIRFAIIKIKKILGKIWRKTKRKITTRYQKSKNNNPIDNDMVFLHTFDGEIKGNTKAVLNSLLNTDFRLVISSTQETSITKASNITYVPRHSKQYYHYANMAKFHILETWGDLTIKKRPGSCWIQLWHGTPIKKLLLDSNEVFITNKNRQHKRNKIWDIIRWDYLLSQNKFCTSSLSTAFCFNKSKILEIGYPRTDIFYHTNHDLIRTSIKEKYKIHGALIIYAPTWRDYNKYSFIKNFQYLLDPELLDIGESYTILFVGHHFDIDVGTSRNFIYSADDAIEDLIIAGDFLITDYSSILFDWMETKKPFSLLWKDIELFSFDRGIYCEIKNDFCKFIARDEYQLTKLIKSPLPYEFIKNKERYSVELADSSKNMIRFISSLRNKDNPPSPAKKFPSEEIPHNPETSLSI